MPKINELPAASALTATDLLAMDNSSGTATKKVSGQQIKDYVTADVAADVTDLKNAINDLDGGSTGQVLRKKSVTDYDFEWASIGQPTDEQTATAVTAWLDDHPEATTTVQDGSLTFQKFATVYKQAHRWNVMDYGIIPDTGNDLYSDIYDFLMDNVNGVGGIVYFPAGRYVISDCIFIPPNTVFVGDGYATEIYFTAEYTSIGVVLSNGGDHCGVMNMRVNTPNTSGIGGGANVGAIGFGTFSITGWQKHSGASSLTRRNTKDVFAVDIFTDSDYILQTETGETYTIDDVVYQNIHARGSAVSVGAIAKITNVNICNVTCSLLRLGQFSGQNVSVNCNNVQCGRLITTGTCRINNIEINDDLFLDNFAYTSACAHVAGTLILSNAYISTSTRNYVFERRLSTIIMENVFVDAPNANFLTYSTNTGKEDNWYTNIHTNTKSTVFYGYASNFYGTVASTSELHEISYAPIYVKSNTDLNDYTMPGTYQCDTGATAQSLSHCPTTDSFVLTVYTKGAYNIQEVTNGAILWIRNRTSGGWSSWYKTTMTEVV